MDKKYPVLIVENTAFFKKGQLLESYKILDEGIEDQEGNYLAEGNYILLTEKLSKDDEERIKEMVRTQLKSLFWNLYTKSNVLISHL